MSELQLRRTECGNWITNWMGKDHHVHMSTVDDLEFVSMGLIGLPPVRIEITPKGEILNVSDNRTGQAITELRIPIRHFLHQDMNIGKPFSE